MLAAPALTDGRPATEGLSYVRTSSLDDGVGRMLLADAAVAVAMATPAIQTAGPRWGLPVNALALLYGPP
ncbi:hypothetical protein EDD93_5452 [Streptomyces sp. 840.1]|nr:hypothetical protein EDD93_5452 [Streptomyces sp. 840.1]